jgi:Domain of unknown function (DUF4156)
MQSKQPGRSTDGVAHPVIYPTSVGGPLSPGVIRASLAAFGLNALVLVAGCSPVPLSPEARQVRIVTSDPSGCQYLGEVTGNQGNSFTGGFTSNADLETGARNDMKNQALRLGANTIQLLSTRAGQTGNMSMAKGSGGGSVEQTNVTYVGGAYRCPMNR